MELSDSFLGGYFSKTINIRQFKTKNAFTTTSNFKMSKINENTILTKLKSINPNIDLANVSKEMKLCETELQKYNYQALYDSPDTLNNQRLLPIYDTITSDLQTLKVVKSDLYQKKRSKMYVPLPTFTPRGNIIPGQTLLITVSFYYPFHWTKDQGPDDAVIPHCKNVFQFYDTQTLQNLKQAFKCENADSEISGDISDNPHKPFEYIVNSDLKHGLFYINNNIYVDSEVDGKTMAHAETIKEWAHKNGRTIGDIFPMNTTQFLDLEVRIGQPYVYQHLGYCEHLFIINEISFAQSTDCLGQNNYPRLICMSKEKVKNCLFCNKCIASIVMICNEDRTPVTVNHMCESCFISFNYDHLGDKVSNFKAYRTFKWKK